MFTRRLASCGLGASATLATYLTFNDSDKQPSSQACENRRSTNNALNQYCRVAHCEKPLLRTLSSPRQFDPKLPVFKLTEVAKHDGVTNKTLYVHHNGFVYDITKFIEAHPGGEEVSVLSCKLL